MSRHANSCSGVRHRCDKCQGAFRFKRQYQEHRLWSPSCGSMAAAVAGDDVVEEPGCGRYLGQRAPSVVRLAVSGGQSVVGINCRELLDPAVFVRKGRRRVRCGMCDGCTAEENCGRCAPCSRRLSAPGPGGGGRAAGRAVQGCEGRRCMNLVEQYKVARGAEAEATAALLGNARDEEKGLTGGQEGGPEPKQC